MNKNKISNNAQSTVTVNFLHLKINRIIRFNFRTIMKRLIRHIHSFIQNKLLIKIKTRAKANIFARKNVCVNFYAFISIDFRIFEKLLCKQVWINNWYFAIGIPYRIYLVSYIDLYCSFCSPNLKQILPNYVNILILFHFKLIRILIFYKIL